MSSMAAAEHIALARSLPPQLLRFFKRFPPPQLSVASSDPPAPQESVTVTSNTSSEDTNIGATASTIPLDQPPVTVSNQSYAWKKNPFLPHKNPNTGNWHGPHYSLRRQADLFKLASAHGVLSLMPHSPKHPEVKAAKRIEHGLRVKGTGEGQRVKGKYWERTLRQRLEIRKQAMEGMSDMINLWKERGHGRGWKKYPKGKGMSALRGDEVFRVDMRHAWVHERAATNA